MRSLFVVVFACWAALVSGEGWAADAFTMPEGFRGRDFGSPKSTFKGLVFQRKFKDSGFVEAFVLDLYTLKNDALDYAGVKVDKIEYGFLDDEFYAVFIDFTGEAAYEAILTQSKKEWGREQRMFKSRDGDDMVFWYSETRKPEIVNHVWRWGVADTDVIYPVGLYFSPGANTGRLSFGWAKSVD